MDTADQPAPRFFSLKWRALLILSLLLLVIFLLTTFYTSSNLLSQFEQERKSNYARQVKELDGMMRQSSAALLTFADIVPAMDGMEQSLLSGNANNIALAFEDHWQSLQLGAAIDAAQIYSTRSILMQSWKSEGIKLPDAELIKSQVQEVNKMEQPLTFLNCTDKCMQFAVVPMLAKGRNSGVIVLGATLATGIIGFKEITGVDIGILNVSDNGGTANGQNARTLPDWRASVSALTNLEQNLPLLQSVAARQHSLAALGTGLRETFKDRKFEVHVIPLKKFSVRGNAYVVLIEDITQGLSLINKNIWRDIAYGLLSLLASELILLLILWKPLSRLKQTTELLPLLAQNDFDKLRQAVSKTRRTVWLEDEFDLLEGALTAVAHQLENLQAEVAKRASALNEVNIAIARLNEELEQKIKTRTRQLSEANTLMEHLNEELEQKVKERTRQLLEVQENLVHKEKLALLGQVAGAVSHELRNPLGVISNAVFYLQSVQPDADEKTREYLDIIKNEIAGAERIVSDLLDAVRINPPHPNPVGTAELIRLVLRNCNVPPSISVKLDIPETLPQLLVDEFQIHRALRHLINNSVESMPEGGTLEIGASADASAGTITLSVRDSGTGIAPEALAKLFQPLFTTKARGFGLGLVVAKNLVETNGGTVHVESEAGKGTLAVITLPGVSPTT